MFSQRVQATASGSDTSQHLRSEYVKEAFTMIAHHPLRGWGQEVFKRYVRPTICITNISTNGPNGDSWGLLFSRLRGAAYRTLARLEGRDKIRALGFWWLFALGFALNSWLLDSTPNHAFLLFWPCCIPLKRKNFMVKKHSLICLVLSALVFYADLASKEWIRKNLDFGDGFKVFPGLNFIHAHNPGAAFSFLASWEGHKFIFFRALLLRPVFC